ncbi:hypothetical protein TIFTF001_056231 [Ficus carica]|uniref:Uncharacterized protein n=1 Tax=Ficus carica TaxID=3494 RepID=A0AA88EK57_FICCA|nr:hypothetical protein TIFTF001_056231 [Ficus carica]
MWVITWKGGRRAVGSRLQEWKRHGLGWAAVAGGVGYLRRNLEWFASEVRFRTSYKCQ